MHELIDLNMFEDEIKILEKRALDHQNKDGLIAFYGSSSIRLWETLNKDLAPLNIINLGFGGSSFSWCIYFFSRVFRNLKPSEIVIYVGDNDLGNGLPPEKVLKKFVNLANMVRLHFHDIKIHFITIKPSPERTYLIVDTFETNRLIRKELLKLGRAKMINVFDSMLDGNGVARPELYQDDKLHLNEKGYKIWTGVLRRHFEI
jgi:lysophospholipase L1-like esterase